MASATRRFDCIIARCRERWTNVQIVARDERPTRALLKITAKYGDCDIYITEIILSGDARKYAYYVLRAGNVIAGFDNAPDPDALKLKYGVHYSQRRLEQIPHLHSAGKRQVSLTDAVDFELFIGWVDKHL